MGSGRNAEKPNQRLEQSGGVVLLPAPCAGRIGAGRVAERADERARLRERVTHPWRHHRVSAGDGDPRQRVGQRPAAPLGIVEDRGDLVDAGFRGENPRDRASRLVGARTRTPADGAEDGVEARLVGASRRQPVERGQQIRVPLAEPGERLDLVPQDLEREPRVELRIVDVARLKASVLMVFDEVVVRVLRKREGVEPQGVDRGFPDHLQPARGRGEMVQVEADDVVTEQEGALPGERVKPPERGGGIAGPVDQRGLAVRPDRGEGEDARGGGIDLEVDRDAVPEQRRGVRGRGSDPVFHRSASSTSSQAAENIPTL